ncbi:hypothetical protein MASR2M78_05550 [Treponema sp.]
MAKRLEDRHIRLKIDTDAKDFLIQRGYDPLFGARPLKRALQAELENPLAKAMIAGTVMDGSLIHVGVAGDALSFLGEGA